MTRRRAVSLVSLLACAGIAWGVYQAGFDSTPPPGNAGTMLAHGTAIGNHLTTRSWELRYDNVQASNDGNLIQATGVKDAIIYNKKHPKLHLWADHVTVNMATKDLDMHGHVHITTVLGGQERIFDTESATWTDSSGSLLMPNDVNISDKHTHVKIQSVTVDTKTGDVKLGRITGLMH